MTFITLHTLLIVTRIVQHCSDHANCSGFISYLDGTLVSTQLSLSNGTYSIAKYKLSFVFKTHKANTRPTSTRPTQPGKNLFTILHTANTHTRITGLHIVYNHFPFLSLGDVLGVGYVGLFVRSNVSWVQTNSSVAPPSP